MKTLVIILGILFSTMSLHWYDCKNCGQAIKKDGTPSSSGCSKSSSHNWYDLGEVGDKNYSCKECGLMVQTRSTPSSSGCTSGSSHNWYEQ